MSWHASMTWEIAQKRAVLLSKVRSYFEDNNVIEVETPLLSLGTVTDVYLDAFKTKYDFLLEGQVDCYLQTSPEFAMKRLLASGYQDIFQICKAFRDEPFGSHHNPEFTMLEWYRLDYDHFDLMDDVEDLLKATLNIPGVNRISYQEAFLLHLSLDPLSTTIEQCLDVIDKNEMSECWLTESEDLDLLLQFLFTQVIEPKIGLEQPCFVYNFPASQASLARIDAHDKCVANRFECYYKGVELANGFYELSNSSLQLTRFKQDNIKRKAKGMLDKPIDNRFIKALEEGLPNCSGVALGLDRLVMLALQLSSIDKVLTFPIKDA